MEQRAYVPRELPPGLEALATLALDLRWTWSHGADHLWRALDAQGWELTRNPWVLLQEASTERLARLASDAAFRRDLGDMAAARERYLAATPMACPLARPVAYFSMEFALGEAIPLYAGGLGVLAGDHLKAASDLGVPVVGVGLLYQEGYFRQLIDSTGRQEELYPYNDPTSLPIQPVRGPGGAWVTVGIDLPGRTLRLRAWRAVVGRVELYLLDSNVVTNDPVDRGITGKLYGDGPELRIRQELVLGVGGLRLLDALGIVPGACHMNEGHAAFLVLERARLARRAHGLTFREALATTRAGNIFTTHTPVAAGFDAFAPALVARYLPDGGAYLGELGLPLDDLLALGRAPGAAPSEPFRPAYLALRGAGHVNGVSVAHAETSRELFEPLFPRLPRVERPIGSVTNGVHMPTWDSAFADELWTAALGPGRWRGDVEGLAAGIAAVSDEALWSCRAWARAALVKTVRSRQCGQVARRGATADAVQACNLLLDPDVLTLGFARRFATYKRPDLLLRDRARLLRLLADARRPVQLVVAGKAHPEDAPGKALVEEWARFCERPDVRARCVFLEDYDLRLAQELVQGVDVWLNTPRRPWEACGTSGMKVLVNGGLNLSSLDGWWGEAYEPGVGWALDGRDDAADTRKLFDLLEGEIIPTFYDRDAGGLPRRWLALVRTSLSRLTPRFSANRMLREYVTDLYAPAERALERRLGEGCAAGRALDRWSRRLTTGWAGLHFGRLDLQEQGDHRTFTVEVFLNDLAPAEVAVELYADPEAPGRAPERVAMSMTAGGPIPGTSHGFTYTATTPVRRPAAHYTPRVVPAHPDAVLPLELPLIAWRS